jgi:hypothetical protein
VRTLIGLLSAIGVLSRVGSSQKPGGQFVTRYRPELRYSSAQVDLGCQDRIL